MLCLHFSTRMLRFLAALAVITIALPPTQASGQTPPAAARAPNDGSGEPTRLLRDPTMSSAHIAFEYANDIWVAPRAGGDAKRITRFQGQETNPRMSPDGNWLAFSAQYAGNVDVYVVPVEGGEPRRLTWHPGAMTSLGVISKQITYD